MPSTQKLIVACFALLIGVAFGLGLSRIMTYTDTPIMDAPAPIVSEDKTDFKEALLPLLETRFGTTTGYEPAKVMHAYPNLKYEDFNGVEAVIGKYEFKEGYLWYVNSENPDAAADDITDEGYKTLYANIRARLQLDEAVPAEAVVEQLLADTAVEPLPGEPPAPDQSADPDIPISSPVACTEEAKLCADGSSVSRSGPNCEFAACPDETPVQTEVVCGDAQRDMVCTQQYEPVCASYQVQCITTPCDPVPKTYGNACTACSDNNVISYTQGECAL